MPHGAVTVCGVLNLISSCCTCPAHLQGKHKVMAKNFNLKEKSIWMPYKFCCCEFLRIWVVVSPALQVTLSGLKKKLQNYWLSDKCGVQIFITIPVCVCAWVVDACMPSYICLLRNLRLIKGCILPQLLLAGFTLTFFLKFYQLILVLLLLLLSIQA